MKPTKIAFTKKYFPEQYHGEDYFIEYLLEEGDTLCDAFKKAKEDTFQCFKKNNPQLQWYDEVPANGNSIKKTLHTFTVPPEPGNHSNKEIDTTTYSEDGSVTSILNKSVSLGKTDNDFNLIEEISKSKKTSLLRIYKPMCKTEEEKRAYDEKFVELSAQEGKPLLKTQNSIKINQ